jgi:hypothetical protein
MNMAIARRTRRPAARSGTVDELKKMVDSLIKENQKLKRQLVRLEAKTASRAGAASVTRGLGSIARRVERALSSSPASSRRGRARRTTATAPRKPASPETRAKRLAALARAREARAAKKAAAS